MRRRRLLAFLRGFTGTVNGQFDILQQGRHRRILVGHEALGLGTAHVGQLDVRGPASSRTMSGRGPLLLRWAMKLAKLAAAA